MTTPSPGPQEPLRSTLKLPAIPRLNSSLDKENLTRSKPLSKESPLQSRRILRYGETLESLFLIDMNKVDPQHLKLCRQIIDGTSADDPDVWRKVLSVVESHSVAGTFKLAWDEESESPGRFMGIYKIS